MAVHNTDHRTTNTEQQQVTHMHAKPCSVFGVTYAVFGVNEHTLSSSFAHSGDVPRAARPVFLHRSVARDIAACVRIRVTNVDHPARLKRSVICASQVFM